MWLGRSQISSRAQDPAMSLLPVSATAHCWRGVGMGAQGVMFLLARWDGRNESGFHIAAAMTGP